MIKYRKDTDDIVTLTLDRKGSATNIINHHIGQILDPVIEQLREEKAKNRLNGVILTSAKKTFLTGGEIDYLYQADDAQHIFELTERLKIIYRRLETLGVPVVAAINGSAVGSGFELALACHHRIALDSPSSRIGMPEVALGLMPSAGGIVRLVWLLGLEAAFPILIKGIRYRPIEALKMGLIDEVVANRKELIIRAKEWIFNNQGYERPWDQEKYEIPGGSVKNHFTAKWISRTNANLMGQTKGNYPAPHAILSTMVEATSVDFDTANRIESRYFTQLVLGRTSKNMTKVFWYDFNAIRKNIGRPKGFGKFRPKKIGIVGAGRMGSAIAVLSATYGLDVVLKDVSKSVAERGRKYCGQLLQQRLEEGKITPAEKSKIFERISTTELFQDFETCDVVIEAVFENLNLKRRVIVETEQHLDEFTLFGTNTSSLSISRLAKASMNPGGFIGIRFYAPADTEILVDIICGEQTSAETLARAYDFVRSIGKLPIVIRDRRGFYTPRISGMYAMEGLALLNEGVPPVLIERLGIKAGMPKGPLAMMDEMSLATTLIFEKRKQEWYKEIYYHQREIQVLDKMVNELNRPGKLSKAGFYDYSDNESTLWETLREHFPTASELPSEEAIIERLLFVQALDAVRCLEEKTIEHIAEANLGSIYGWGFPGFKGGVIQYINDYGIEDFVERAKTLEARYGSRFSVPKMLIEMMENQTVFV